MAQKTILIIDDTEGIFDAMTEVLTMEGYNILTAQNEEEVHEVIEEKDGLPDLIFLDVLLSGQDGRIIAQYLKQHTKTKHIPIIMMSAHPDVSKTIFESGADDFISKPFEMDVLFNMIKKHLKQ